MRCSLHSANCLAMSVLLLIENTLKFWWFGLRYSQHISKPCCTDSCKSYKLVGRELAALWEALPPNRSFSKIKSDYFGNLQCVERNTGWNYDSPFYGNWQYCKKTVNVNVFLSSDIFFIWHLHGKYFGLKGLHHTKEGKPSRLINHQNRRLWRKWNRRQSLLEPDRAAPFSLKTFG